MKHQDIVTVLLLVGIGFVGSLFLQGLVANYRLAGDNSGYEPVQPIAYSHRLHAGELGIDCQHCHSGAETSRMAGIPSAGTCMNCHTFITAPFNVVRTEDEAATRENRKSRRIISPELKKLYDALGLDEELRPDPTKEQTNIEWVRIHKVPDFASFDHRAHVGAGVDCQTCHGEVQTMERVRQVSTLSMGWCVNCHRDANARGIKGKKVDAPLDCVACHY
ncbi:MAG: cytochrome c3 family protein [Ignavibacterium sp.]|jgi:hypothetical protein